MDDARKAVAKAVKLPDGYTIEWGGQFENMQRAERRLLIVVPLALALILSLLYLTFNSFRDALMIFSGVLFARVGGVFGLWVMGLPFTISAGVGFVVLSQIRIGSKNCAGNCATTTAGRASSHTPGATIA